MESNKTSTNEDSGRDGPKTLHTAAYEGNLPTVKILVQSHRVDVNAKDKSNNTALYIAAENSHLDIVKYLVDDANADINAKNNGGKTILHAAASTGSLELVKSLIGKGADASAKDDRGLAPLPYAAKYGQLHVIKYFIEEIGANVNVVCNFLARPLAAYYGHAEVVKYLATKENGFLVGFSNRISLLSAIKNGHLHIVQDLPIEPWEDEGSRLVTYHNGFNFGLRMNKMREIPQESEDLRNILKYYDKSYISDEHFIVYALFLAVQSDHHDVFKHLIEQKHVNVNSEFVYGGRIIDYAASNGLLDIVKYIVNLKEVDLNATSACDMTTVLFAIKNNRFDVVKFLVSKGATLNSKTHKALVVAATTGNLKLVKYLVNHGASVNDEMENDVYVCEMTNDIWEHFHTKHFGGTVLYNAVKHGHLDIVKYLIKHGATIDHDSFNEAAKQGQLDTVKYFIEKGATIEKDTLNEAAKSGHLDIVEYIVKQQQLEALYFAIQNCHFDVVKYFIGKTSFDAQSNRFSKLLNGVVEKCHLDLVKYLVNRGANLFNDAILSAISSGNLDKVKYVLDKTIYNFNSVSNADNLSLLLHAVEKGHLNIVKYFVEEKHLDFNSPYRNGSTPLEKAVLFNHLDIVKYLVEEKQVDPQIKILHQPVWFYRDTFFYIAEKSSYSVCDTNKNNLNACLFGAAEADDLNLLKHLVYNTTKFDANSTLSMTETPLYYAILNGDADMAKYLIENYGADVNAKNEMSLLNTGDLTALHVAAAKGDPNLVEYLLNKGADINVKDAGGLSPLDVAKMCCNNANAELLKSKGATCRRRNAESEDLPKLSSTSVYDDSDPPEKLHTVSASGIRLSSWINVFAHTVAKGVMGVSKYMYSFGSLALDATNYPQSSNSMTIKHNDVDVASTLFLLDVFVRKFTGQGYISTAESSVTLTRATGDALLITEEFEKALKIFTQNKKIPVDSLNIDFVKIQQDVTRKLMNGKVNEIVAVLKLNAEKAFDGIDLKYADKKNVDSSIEQFDIKVDGVLNKIMAKIVDKKIINPLDQNVARQQQFAINLQNYLNMSSSPGHAFISN